MISFIKFVYPLYVLILKIGLIFKLMFVNQSLKQENKLIFNALYEALFNQNTTDEKNDIIYLKKIRRELNSSKDIFHVPDFGASNPNGDSKLVERHVGKMNILSSKSHFWSLFVYKLLVKNNRKSLLELGTCCGLSSAYMSLAIKNNSEAALTSIEGIPEFAELSKRTLKTLNVSNSEIKTGLFLDIIPQLLAEKNHYDFVFIDGHHDEKATVKYFMMIKPMLTEGAILMFDDISWSKGMRNAWKTIAADKNIQYSLDLMEIGVCVYSG